MSLMECQMMNRNLHVDPVFDPTQAEIWTADKSNVGVGVTWYVYFNHGRCGHLIEFRTDADVRVVRSGQ
jgi:hypothetical protein